MYGFDNPLSPPLVNIPRSQSTRNCRLAEGPGGRVVDAATGEPYSLCTASCVAISAHVGHNPEATVAMRQAVKVFVTDALLR